MSTRRVFSLVTPTARLNAMRAVRDAPEGWVVRVSESTRSLEQNALQWKILGAFSKQLPWVIGGERRRLDPETWKQVLTAAYRNETLQAAEGIHGGLVVVGMATSDMGKRSFSDWLAFLEATAVELGVRV